MAPYADMVLLLLVTSCLGRQSSPKSSYYTAAVVEYSAVGNISVDDPRQVLMMNAERYLGYVKESARSGADIIVFPECGLSTIYLPENRPEIRPLLTSIPDPTQRKNPCLDTLGDVPEVLSFLACAARNHSIYVVVNLPEIAHCAGADCPSDGAFFYNTDVTFDRSGILIARYRKYNLFGEPGFDVTSSAELSTFDTDFGVRFGMATCFDIYFHDPIMKLVQELNVTDIVFPVAWFSELPFLTAIQIQDGWSRTLDVNLLASGYDDPANRNGGSGIYAGKVGRLAATMPFSKTSKLLISRVPKKTSGLFGNNSSGQSESSNIAREGNRPSDFQSERIFFTDYLAPYTTQLLETTNTRTELCNRELCCQFDVRTEVLSGDPSSASYRLAVFNGIRPFFGGRTGGIQVCAIISCNNFSLSSCGQPISIAKKLTTFKFISIQMNSSRVNSIHMPTTLLKSILPLDVDSYEMTSRNLTDKQTHNHIRTRKNIRNLWTFGIYTREYDLDGFPFTVAT